MPATAPASPRATSFVASCATLDDTMPRDRALELGLQSRPFTVAARRDRAERALDPDLIVVTPDGKLRRFTPSDGEASAWREETFDLPEMSGATIVGVQACEMDPQAGETQLVVIVSAIAASHRPLLAVLRRTARGWSRATLPLGPFGDVDLARELAASFDAGFAGLANGKIMTFYGCLRRSSTSLMPYGFDAQGRTILLAPMGLGRGVDRLIGLQDGRCAIVRWADGALTLSVAELDALRRDESIIPLRFAPAGRKPLPIGVLADASGLRPVVDGQQICRGLVARDAEGHLAFVAVGPRGELGEPARLNDGAGPAHVRETAVSVGDDGGLHLFAADADGALWHTQWDERSGPDAPAWTPTGHQARQLSAPARFLGPPRVFVERPDGGGVDQVSRASDGEWVRDGVAIGAAQVDCEPTVVHAIQVSSVTAQSEAVAGALLEVRADRPVIVEHEGRLVRLTPTDGFRVRSNATGSVRFKMRAEGLDAPVLTFTYPEEPTIPPVAFRPQDEALRRLAGLDPRFSVTDEALRAGGLLPANLSPPEAARLGEAIRAAALGAYGQGAEQPMQFQKRRLMAAVGAGPPPVGVVLRRTPAGLTVTPANDAEQGAAGRMSAAPAASGAFWNWLHGVWDRVESFAVHVVDGAVKLVVETAGQVMEFLADTARRIGDGLQALLAWIGRMGAALFRAGRRVIDWLAEKLGWDDVLRAKDAVKAFAHRTLVDLEDCVGQAIPEAVHRGLDWARGQVGDLFDRAIQVVGGESAGHGGRVRASPLRGKLQSHGAAALSIQHAVPDRPSERPLFSLSADFHDRVARLAETAREIGQGEALRDALETVTRLLEGRTDLAEGAALLLADILRALKPLALLALDLADVVQTLVFELIAKVIGLVRTVMETAITALGAGFSWINSIYRRLSGADLSIADLSSLLFVTPGVILHHLLVGGAVVPKDRAAPPAETFLAATPGLLDAAMRADAASPHPFAANGSVTPITDAARRFFEWVQPVYRICSAVWTVLRAIVCLPEDGLRVADLSGAGPSGPARKVFTWLVRIADWTLLAWAITRRYFDYLGAWIEQTFFRNAQMIIAIGVLGLFILFAVVFGGFLSLLSTVSTVLAVPIIWLTAVIMLLYGVGMLIYTLVEWIKRAPDAKDKARFHVGQTAETVLHLRQCLQLGVPVGLLLVKAPNPVTAALGATMISVNMSGNTVFYAIGGLLMGVAETL